MFWSKTIVFFVVLATICESQAESRIKVANYNGNRGEPIDIERSIPAGEDSNATIIRNGDGEGEEALLINTGNSLEVRLSAPRTNLLVTGPPLDNRLYVFNGCMFDSAGTFNGVAGTTVNGINGTALELELLYYNTRYSSYIDALEREDGVFKVRLRVNATAAEDNDEFEPFARKMEAVRNPGSTKIEMKEHNKWFLQFPATTYYIYSGSVKNASTGETFNCAVTTVTEEILSISRNQFERTFLKLKDSGGAQLITAQEQEEQGSRPTIHATEKVFVENPDKINTKIPSRFSQN